LEDLECLNLPNHETSKFHSFSLFHFLGNKGQNFLSRHSRTEKLNYLSFAVDEEFGEVPGNQLGSLAWGIV
jgi:hypothetical protein